MTYAKAIKLLRDRMLVSQTELASLLGTTQVSICRWESGKYEPSLKTKRQLKEYFIKYKINIEK